MIEHYKGFEISIEQDECARNPREDDNLGTILYTSKRYDLGDRLVTQDEIEEIKQRPDVIWIPVYAYIHSDVHISTCDFNDRWDSGCCGIIYTTLDQANAAAYSNEKAIKEILKSEIETFSHYLAGEVYCYSVSYHGDVLESCCGYYSIEMAFEDAKTAADNIEINDCSNFKIVNDDANETVGCK